MGIFPVIFSKHPINSPITVFIAWFYHRLITFAARTPMRLGTERQDWADLHGHIPGVSTAFNSGAAPPVLRAGQAWCLIIYLDRVITGQLAKAASLQAESLQQEENSFHDAFPSC